MRERITKDNLNARVQNLNRRMAARGSLYRYFAQGRNGYTGLDRVLARNGAVMDCVVTGTKREIADYLHLMMIALDDAEVKS